MILCWTFDMYSIFNPNIKYSIFLALLHWRIYYHRNPYIHPLTTGTIAFYPTDTVFVKYFDMISFRLDHMQLLTICAQIYSNAVSLLKNYTRTIQ